MKFDGELIEFASGETAYANGGIIGMPVEGDPIDISQGWDGSFGDYGGLAKPDAIELADHMIARWTEFKRIYEAKP